MGFLSDLFGGGDSNNSSSSSSTTTNQTDRRIANDSGLVLQGDANKFDSSTHLANSGNNSSDNRITDNSVTTVTDGGAVNAAMGTVTAGVGVIGKGFTDLLKGATDIFTVESNNSSKNFKNLLDTSETNNTNALDVGRDGLTRSYGAFDKLVQAAGSMFDAGTKQNQIAAEVTTKANQTASDTIARAYQTATAEKSGAIDNKTIMVLGLAAAAAVAMFAFKK